MELFRITCVTCSAKLSVRNRAVIGQILACPKCGSMVEIVEPASRAAQPSAETASEAPEPWSDLPSPEASSSTEPAPAANGAPGELLSDSAPSTAEDALTNQPAPNWEVAAGASRYRLIAVGVSAATAIAVLGGILLSSWSGKGPSNQAAAETLLPVDSTENATDEDGDVVDSLDPVDAEAIDETATEVVEPVQIETSSAPPEASVVDDTLELDESPQDPSPDASAVSPQPLATPNDGPPSDRSDPETPAPKPTLRIDPLDVDPEGFNLELLSSQDDLHPSAHGSDASGEALPSDPPPAELEAGPPLAENQSTEAALRNFDAVHRVATSSVDEILSREFPRIQITRMPLCEFVDWMTALSGVPISVSPTELQRAGVSATRAVSIDRSDVGVLAALEEAFAKLRLQPVVDGAQVVLKRSSDNPLRTVHYPLDDLVGRETSAEQIAGWIREIVSPETWNDSEPFELRDDRLTITCPECVQYEVLLLLERIRLARGIPARTSYPRRLLMAESSYAAMNERLSAPAVFTFTESTTLQEVVRHWQQELGTPILVDWPALAELDLWPRSEVWCRADRDTWREALDDVLHPLSLAWTTPNGRTLVITTESAASKMRQIEFYPLPAASADSIAARVAKIAEASSAEAATIFDPVANALIISAPPKVQQAACGLADLAPF